MAGLIWYKERNLPEAELVLYTKGEPEAMHNAARDDTLASTKAMACFEETANSNFYLTWFIFHP
jgi:hypothetical protein